MDPWRQIELVLGGELTLGQPIASEADIHDVAANGVPLAAVEALASRFDVSQSDIGKILQNIFQPQASEQPNDTDKFMHYQAAARIPRLEKGASLKLLRAARVFAHARAVFGSDIEAGRWFKTAQQVLEHQRPIKIMGTSEGCDIVDDVLTRIEHGVFA